MSRGKYRKKNKGFKYHLFKDLEQLKLENSGKTDSNMLYDPF